jgi:hypothetical protein
MELFVMSRNLLDRRVSAQLVAENLLLKCGRGRDQRETEARRQDRENR